MQAYSKKDDNAAKENQYKVRFNMGINHRNLGRYFESVFEFGKAIELFEKPAAYNNCGLSNFENENYPQAATDFNNAIKKSLNKPVAAHFNNLGLAYYF